MILVDQNGDLLINGVKINNIPPVITAFNIYIGHFSHTYLLGCDYKLYDYNMLTTTLTPILSNLKFIYLHLDLALTEKGDVIKIINHDNYQLLFSNVVNLSVVNHRLVMFTSDRTLKIAIWKFFQNMYVVIKKYRNASLKSHMHISGGLFFAEDDQMFKITVDKEITISNITPPSKILDIRSNDSISCYLDIYGDVWIEGCENLASSRDMTTVEGCKIPKINIGIKFDNITKFAQHIYFCAAEDIYTLIGFSIVKLNFQALLGTGKYRLTKLKSSYNKIL